MNITSILRVLIVSAFLYACKSTKKLFDEGQYQRAFYSAVDDLRKNPSNEAAQQVLPDAYRHVENQQLNNIALARSGGRSGEKLDRIVSIYRSLQKMYEALLSSPAGSQLVHPVDYSPELSSASLDGADFHYNNGIGLMDRNDKKSYQKAYEEFKITDNYVPGYKDVIQLKAEALDLSVTNIAINTIRQQFGAYGVNGSFLENDIQNSLNNIGRNYYYKFYAMLEAQSRQVRVDQFMDIEMYDIYFGRVAVNNYSYDVSRTIKEPAADSKEASQSITVTATVKVTRRIMDSRAAMDCRISDADSRRILFSQRFSKNYTWENLTGTYTGDQRALSEKDKAIVNGAYNNPPDYNDLYRELTRQLMEDFNYRMRQLYGH